MTDSGKLIKARAEVPDSSDLQQRILAATKGMPQETVYDEPVSNDKPVRLNRSADWPLFPAAIAASLILSLGVWMSIERDLPSAINGSGAVNIEVVKENMDSVISVVETPLSAVELELYDVLILEDDLILAQF